MSGNTLHSNPWAYRVEETRLSGEGRHQGGDVSGAERLAEEERCLWDDFVRGARVW